MATTVASKTITFRSTSPDLVLVREPTDEVIGLGNKVRPVAGSGLQYRFVEHQLVVTEDQDPRPGPSGEDETAVEWLRRHPLLHDRFFEIQPPPPDAGPVLAEIATLTANRDIDRLVEIFEEERTGHERKQVLDTAAAALKGLEATQPPTPE